MLDVTPYVEGMRRRMAAREARERQAKQLARQVVERVVAALSRHPTVRRAWLYGSLVYHHFHDRSDIDIAVEGASQQELDVLAQELQPEAPFPLDLRDFARFPPPFQELIRNFGELLYDQPGNASGPQGRSPQRLDRS